jgi:hypothetical protein
VKFSLTVTALPLYKSKGRYRSYHLTGAKSYYGRAPTCKGVFDIFFTLSAKEPTREPSYTKHTGLKS